jgi:hypothetical protein
LRAALTLLDDGGSTMRLGFVSVLVLMIVVVIVMKIVLHFGARQVGKSIENDPGGRTKRNP